MTEPQLSTEMLAKLQQTFPNLDMATGNGFVHFLATALEEQRQGYIEKVEMYFGSRNIGDKHLDIQKEVLAILKKEKQL